MGLFQELQRRKVIRAVLAYGAAAFVAAQITQLLVDSLGLDPWILKAVVILAIVALPFVIGLAWAFDASRDGVRLAPDGSASDGAAAFPWRRLTVPLLASGVLLLGAFIFFRNSSSKPLNGDREVAVQMYRRYLLHHERAEPSLKQVDDAVRREFARLTAERSN